MERKATKFFVERLANGGPGERGRREISDPYCTIIYVHNIDIGIGCGMMIETNA